MPRRATYWIVQPSQELASYVKKARCCLHRVWALNSSHKDWFRETLSGTARTRVAGWEWLVGRTAQAWGEHHEYGPSQCLSLLCNRLFFQAASNTNRDNFRQTWRGRQPPPSKSERRGCPRLVRRR